MKCGSLNLLEPSGPHQASYGTPLPLTFTQNSEVPTCQSDNKPFLHTVHVTVDVWKVTDLYTPATAVSPYSDLSLVVL